MKSKYFIILPIKITLFHMISLIMILSSFFLINSLKNNSKYNSHLKNKYETHDRPLIQTDKFIVQSKIDRGNKIFYTQGIFFDESNNLVESGGLYGESVLIKMKYPELQEISRKSVEPSLFGEGTAKCGDYIYQLTWQERTILKYKHDTLERIKDENLLLDSEIFQGWGLTESEDGNLYESNGSNKIYKLDCKTLKQISHIEVKLNGKPIDRINALAYAEGYIWANVYFSARILKIDPKTGNVEEAYNMAPLIEWELNNSSLTPERLNSGDVLNGIAYNKSDPNKPYFLLTGKKWDHYFIANFR